MIITAIGIASDALGLCTNRSYGSTETGGAWYRDTHYATPSSVYHVTNATVPVEWEHRRRCGQVIHLERQAGNLWAIAEVDVDQLGAAAAADLAAIDLYWSPSSLDTRSAWGQTAELLSLGLTAAPATNALPRVTLHPGDVRDAARHAKRPLAARLTRAVETRARRRPLSIVDLDPPTCPPADKFGKPVSGRHHAVWVDEHDRPLPIVEERDVGPVYGEVEIRPARIIAVH